MKAKPRTAGRPRVVPKDARGFVLRLPRDLHEKLRAIAVFRELSLHQLVWDALAEWAEEHGDEYEAIVNLRAHLENSTAKPGRPR